MWRIRTVAGHCYCQDNGRGNWCADGMAPRVGLELPLTPLDSSAEDRLPARYSALSEVNFSRCDAVITLGIVEFTLAEPSGSDRSPSRAMILESKDGQVTDRPGGLGCTWARRVFAEGLNRIGWPTRRAELLGPSDLTGLFFFEKTLVSWRPVGAQLAPRLFNTISAFKLLQTNRCIRNSSSSIAFHSPFQVLWRGAAPELASRCRLWDSYCGRSSVSQLIIPCSIANALKFRDCARNNPASLGHPPVGSNLSFRCRRAARERGRGVLIGALFDPIQCGTGL
jgi:hypothetical protein